MAASDYYIRKKKTATDLDKRYKTTKALKLLDVATYPGWKEMKTTKKDGKKKTTFTKIKVKEKLIVPSGTLVKGIASAKRVINTINNYNKKKLGSKTDFTVTFIKIRCTLGGKTVEGWVARKLPSWKTDGLKEFTSNTLPDTTPTKVKSYNLAKEDSDSKSSVLSDKDAASMDKNRRLRTHVEDTFITRMSALADPNAYKLVKPGIETKLNVTKHDDPDQFNMSNGGFEHALRARTIIYKDRNKWDYKYNRMQWANPYYAVGPTREYLFFTKPDLHIMGESKMNSFDKPSSILNPKIADPFWEEMQNNYRDIISDLQYSAMRSDKKHREHDKSEFIRILTNAVSGTLDLPDVSSETVDTPANIYGTTLQYKKSGAKSDEGFDFSLEFTDNQQLQVYHLFKMWSEYSNLKDIGMVDPPGKQNLNPYRINHILHDQIGIFKFIVDDDMETIIYYAYLTGCFPKSVPRGSFANINPGLINYSIDWHAQFVEDMNPLILLHFNMLVRKQLGLVEFSSAKSGKYGNYLVPLTEKYLESKCGKKYVPIYNNSRQEINGGWRDIPIIHKLKDSSLPTGCRYLLKWYD